MVLAVLGGSEASIYNMSSTLCEAHWNVPYEARADPYEVRG